MEGLRFYILYNLAFTFYGYWQKIPDSGARDQVREVKFLKCQISLKERVSKEIKKLRAEINKIETIQPKEKTTSLLGDSLERMKCQK